MAKFSFLSYKLFPTVLNMSITATVAIFTLVVFRSVFRATHALSRKKIPVKVFYVLWLVVLFRLLCPFSITSERSFFTQYDSPVLRTGENVSVMEYVPTDIVHTEYPTINSPAGFVNHIVNQYMPQGEEQLRADPLEAPVAIATNVWFIGIFGMAMYGLHSYLALKKKLVGALRLKDNIYLCDYITSPFVTGIIRPKIYLPSTLSEKEKEYVIAHEKHHIKRFDHIFKLLAFAALSIHWFNPIVWIAFEFAMRDMEMSCDEAVVKKLGDDIRSSYSQSLLNFATGKHIFAGAPLAFGEGDVKTRINNLYFSEKPNIVYTVFVVVLACIMASQLMLNPDTSKGQILYNGMIYQQSGSPLITIPGERSKNIGVLGEIVDKNAPLNMELSGKNIDPVNLNLPVFINEEMPETIFLTTGDGWVPFTASSMEYANTESWISPHWNSEITDRTVHYTINLADDIMWYGIYEDIYQNGKLITSAPVVYYSAEDDNTTEYNLGFATVSRHNDMGISIANSIDDLTFQYMHNGYVTSSRKIALPDEKYTAMGIKAAFSTDIGSFKLLSNDSFDLLVISFATDNNGAIYTDHTNPDQAAVVVYRFVTSTTPLR